MSERGVPTAAVPRMTGIAAPMVSIVLSTKIIAQQVNLFIFQFGNSSVTDAVTGQGNPKILKNHHFHL